MEIVAQSKPYALSRSTVNGLRRKADEALYFSKWHGKNRVTASGPEVRKEFCSRRITAARDLPLPLEWPA